MKINKVTDKTKSKYYAGGLGFKTKKRLVAYCKEILNRCDCLEGSDYNVIEDVLRMHPNYKDKVGKGQYKIFIDNCPVNQRNKRFMIRRSDGSLEDFSYYKAIHSYSPETRIKNTLRKVIDVDHRIARKDMLKDRKIAGGYVVCEETGLKMKPSEAHLDHYPLQFEEIVGKWFELNNLTISDIAFNLSGDLADESLEKSFKDFHKSIVTYRLVLNKVNLQRGKANVKLQVH